MLQHFLFTSQNCLKAMGKNFHPDCFCCAYCGVQFANSPFYLEDGLPYCETDWNELFTTKCVSCGFPIEAGDRWVEALNNNYHSQCFNCTLCKKNLEGQSFFVKSGKPFCKGHATRMWSVYTKIRNLLLHESTLYSKHKLLFYAGSVLCFCLKKYKNYVITWMHISVKTSSHCRLYYVYIYCNLNCIN